MQPFHILLYLVPVSIWSFTWLAIAYQIGATPIEWSIVLRFFIAGLLQLMIAAFFKERLLLTKREFAATVLQGFLLFCLNYLCVYFATKHLPSGLVAIASSTVLLWSFCFEALFLRTPFDLKALGAIAIGLTGVAFVFSPQLLETGFHHNMLMSLTVCIVGACSTAFGNILWSTQRSVPLSSYLAYSMLIGSFLMTGWALVSHLPFYITQTPSYIGSLLFLAIFGSCLSFSYYFKLVRSIGPGRAAYIGIVHPVIALIISSFAEGYQWTFSSFFGLFLIALGNVTILQKKHTQDKPVRLSSSKV